MNLLSTYLVAKGLNEMSKSGGSYSGGDAYAVVKPSKESIEKVLNEQGDNVALANYVKNLHTSAWDHCDKKRRTRADEKTRRIILRHCRKNGMTKQQENEVEKLAKANMNPVKPCKRVDGMATYKLNNEVRLVVVPNHFTLSQMQYLCACMKEYGMDTLVIARENGKEAHIMSFKGSSSFMKPDKDKMLKDGFPLDKIDATVQHCGDKFCRPYTANYGYTEIHLTAKEGFHLNVGVLKKAVKTMSQVEFHHSFGCPKDTVMPDVPEKGNIGDDILNENQSNNTNDYGTMSAGDEVLNGDGITSIPVNDSIDDKNFEDR